MMQQRNAIDVGGRDVVNEIEVFAPQHSADGKPLAGLETEQGGRVNLIEDTRSRVAANELRRRWRFGWR